MLENNKSSSGVSKAVDLEPKITKAMQRAGREALIRHKREGHPIVSWENGKVVLIRPEDIVIPPAED